MFTGESINWVGDTTKYQIYVDLWQFWAAIFHDLFFRAKRALGHLFQSPEPVTGNVQGTPSLMRIKISNKKIICNTILSVSYTVTLNLEIDQNHKGRGFPLNIVNCHETEFFNIHWIWMLFSKALTASLGANTTKLCYTLVLIVV